MWYLFLQIWVWLIAAFALGWWSHWFYCCRGKDQAQSDSDSNTLATTTVATALDDSDTAPFSTISDSSKPLGFTAPPNSIDDLKRIKGIGAVIEETLNQLGIYQFSQIAEWTSDNIAWVEESLSFPGRIQREDWIKQAQTLAAGGTTEFANRVDQGDLGYHDSEK